MKTYFECFPCVLQQALRFSRNVKANEVQQYQILQGTLSLLQNLPPHATPPEISYQVHQIIGSLIDVHDPYAEAKVISTQNANALYPTLKNLVAQSEDPLATAIRLSIAGNIIDFGMSDQIADLRETIERVLHQAYAINHCEAFLTCLKNADHILFLADNAGETVFDRVLIEELSVPVTYAVKDGPILNDALLEDAYAAGLDCCTTIITNGSQAPGTILSLCSSPFLEQYYQAPMIIAKGQANFETLSDESNDKIFCLLQVKCPVIGYDLNVPAGSIVLRQNIQS